MRRYLHFHLAWPIVVLGGLLALACLISIWYINKLQTNLAHAVRQDVASVQLAQELQLRLRQLRIKVLLYEADPSPVRYQEAKLDQRAFETALTDARNKIDDLPLLDEIAAAYHKYHSQFGPEGIPASAVLDLEGLARWADEHPIRDLLSPCQKLANKHQERMDRTLQQSESQTRWAGGLLIVLGSVGALGGLLAGYAIARWISRTVAQLSVRVQAVHEHLDQEVGAMTVESSQDLGAIDAQLERVIGRVREVCERLHRQERDILRSEQLAAVGQLAAGVAHEVRNPLTGIKILIEAALRPHTGTPLTEEELRMMLDEIGRVERTVQGLLDIVKIPVLRREIQDLRDLVDQETALIQPRADRLRIQLITRKPDFPVTANINRDQFLSVLTNLMINALDAVSTEGRVEVTLLPPSDGKIVLSIADTGTGISSAVADRLFQPFATTKTTGTGLGLSVSQSIIRDHGGTLTAKNRPQGGACFTISLPVSEETQG